LGGRPTAARNIFGGLISNTTPKGNQVGHNVLDFHQDGKYRLKLNSTPARKPSARFFAIKFLQLCLD
jgi:hypothetical protein